MLGLLGVAAWLRVERRKMGPVLKDVVVHSVLQLCLIVACYEFGWKFDDHHVLAFSVFWSFFCASFLYVYIGSNTYSGRSALKISAWAALSFVLLFIFVSYAFYPMYLLEIHFFSFDWAGSAGAAYVFMFVYYNLLYLSLLFKKLYRKKA